jgi:hypothetical protein
VLRGVLAIYFGRFVALVLTSALSLVPANCLMGGAVKAGLAAFGSQLPPALSHSQRVQEKHQDLSGRAAAGELSPDETHAAHALLTREAFEGGTVLEQDVEPLLPILYAMLVSVAILMAGALLAQAALVALLVPGEEHGPCPTTAWAQVAQHLGAVLSTGALAVLLTLLGFALFVLPGIVAAIGFSFAMPVVMLEGLSGSKALQRSFQLMRAEWPAVLGLFVVFVLVAFGASWLSARLLAPGLLELAFALLLRLVFCPLPLAATVLLYLRAREKLEGAQYMRRISAPG